MIILEFINITKSNLELKAGKEGFEYSEVKRMENF